MGDLAGAAQLLLPFTMWMALVCQVCCVLPQLAALNLRPLVRRALWQ